MRPLKSNPQPPPSNQVELPPLKLSRPQLEQTLAFLYNPTPFPPKVVQRLRPLEIYVLEQMLQSLMLERLSNPIH
jgi:hypothetical protein